MCTVSYLPVKERVFITSNRDEKRVRGRAIAPAEYVIDGIGLIYPKDRDAGGTWIAMRDNGIAAVLLNGGFIMHTPTPPYAKSRGLIFLDVVRAAQPVKYFQHIDINNIEPFTLIVIESAGLYECRWDGHTKHCRPLNSSQSYLWSSVTLYDEAVIKKREWWFQQWLKKNPNPSQDDILHFHQFAGDGDTHNDLRMNRDGRMLTVSVTSIELSSDAGKMKYLDLKDNSMHETNYNFLSSYAVIA